MDSKGLDEMPHRRTMLLKKRGRSCHREPCGYMCEQVSWALAAMGGKLAVCAAPTVPWLTFVRYHPAMAEEMWVGPASCIS